MSDMALTLDRLERAASTIESAVAGSSGSERAAGIARALLLLWPGASLVGCKLQDFEGNSWAALDTNGRPYPDSPAAFALPSFSCDLGTPPLGVLAVRAADWSEEDEAALRLLARETVLILRCALAGASTRRCQELSELLALGGPVMHEFNNFLNTLSLRLTLIEMDLPSDQVGALQRLRARSADVAALVARFQSERSERAPERRPTDLAQLVRQMSHESRWQVEVEEGQVPLVLCDEEDLRNLLKFLRRFASAHASRGPGTDASLCEEGEWVRLRVETDAPAPEHGIDYFRAHPAERGQTTGLELAACRSIVNRAGGKMGAVGLEGGRVALQIDLPIAQRTS